MLSAKLLKGLPMLARPKILLDLVEEEGGGGVWICDAVGARDWRIEYVRCIVAVVCSVFAGYVFGVVSKARAVQFVAARCYCG